MFETSNRFVLCFVALMLAPLAQASADEHREMFSDEDLQSVAAAVIADQDGSSLPDDSSRPSSYRPYWILYGWLAVATVYDVETTFYRLNHCDECQEGNPIVRPFIERGKFATYAYSAAVNAIVMYIARRMYNGGHDLWRVAPLTFTIVHGVAGTLNLYLGAYGDN